MFRDYFEIKNGFVVSMFGWEVCSAYFSHELYKFMFSEIAQGC